MWRYFSNSWRLETNFVVLQDVPSDLAIGLPTQRPCGVLYFRSEEVRLDNHGQKAVLPMASECKQSWAPTANTDSEDFTSDSGSAELSNYERLEKKDRELVLTNP